jgi:GNAT superfamily N-acetyltransferase
VERGRLALVVNDAERLALGVVDAERKRRRNVRGSEILEIDGLVLAFSNVADPALNAVVVERAPRDPEPALENAMAAFAERGHPFGIDFQVGRHPGVDAAVRAHDLTLIIERPGMTVALDELRSAPIPDGIVIRRVVDGIGAEAIVGIGMDAFGDDPAVGRAFYGASAFGVEGMATFVAWSGGEPLGMASGYLHRGAVGVMGVGVIERARGHGIGAAITVAAATAFEDADLVWLHPSEMAVRTYERLGFREIARWEVWVSQP